MADTTTVTIEALGARGDGIATLAGRRLYVPYALQGETVRVRIDRSKNDPRAPLTGRLVEVSAPSPDRVEPPCPHFGVCGGCAVQHMAPPAYARWKNGLITSALAARDLPTDVVEPPVPVPSGSRRRADFTAIRRRNDLILGFNARASHRVIDVDACPVLLPEIVALLTPLRAILTDLLSPSDRAEVVVNATTTGLDVLLVTGARLGAAGHENLARFAEDHDLARLSRRHPQAKAPETIVERRPPTAMFGSVPVALPPGAFLQATADGEASLVAAAAAGVGTPRRILDLFCGSGTFSVPLATSADDGSASVHAVDGEADAVTALEAAARAASLSRITSETRDLDRRPFRVEELNRYDAVVFDPPRAGAKRQAEAIAASKVPHVVAISCNPGTFARDAAILVAGGYRLTLVRPVDQFPWTPHLELAAHFVRESGPR